MDELQKAIDAWAVKYAKLYEQHGRSVGGPETWCNEVMLDSAVEDAPMMAALQTVLESAFLKAVG